MDQVLLLIAPRFAPTGCKTRFAAARDTSMRAYPQVYPCTGVPKIFSSSMLLLFSSLDRTLTPRLVFLTSERLLYSWRDKLALSTLGRRLRRRRT